MYDSPRLSLRCINGPPWLLGTRVGGEGGFYRAPGFYKNRRASLILALKTKLALCVDAWRGEQEALRGMQQEHTQALGGLKTGFPTARVLSPCH